MLTLSRPFVSIARPVHRLLGLFRSPASGEEVQNRPKRVEELPEPALRDLGLGREKRLREPEWDPRVPFFFQARYGRER